MSVTISTTLGDLVSEDPRRARVLELFGLDYCCGGQRTLGEAAAASGVDTTAVTAALDLPGEPAPLQWTSSHLADMAHDIVDTHHAYLWEEMPRIAALLAKVATVHGERHGELHRLRELYTRTVDDLEPHLSREERVVFPAIARLEREGTTALASGTPLAASLRELVDEHDVAGDLFDQMNRLTSGYATPSDGCASYAALMAGLSQMEQDLHLHVHKENNVLFPKVMAAVEA